LSDLGKIQRDTEIKRKIWDKISRRSTGDTETFEECTETSAGDTRRLNEDLGEIQEIYKEMKRKTGKSGVSKQADTYREIH
jgi:hypothetical protein